MAWLTFDSLRWDDYHHCVVQEVLQSKTSKSKLVAYVAGSSMHNCWFLSFGDYLCLYLSTILYNEDLCKNWMYPDLQNSETPGRRVGMYLKALQPQSNSRLGVSVEGWPEKISAASIRPGAANTLVTHMPVELACAVTGHDMRQHSALYEYIDAHVSQLIPGSTVLAGWPAFPWGQLGRAPTPANLTPLYQRGIHEATLDSIIDKLYRIDSASPPMLAKTGSLRPAVRCAFATQIMYFEERKSQGEVHEILKSMVQAVSEVLHPGDVASAHNTILSWSTAVRENFQTSNARLLAGSGSGNQSPLASFANIYVCNECFLFLPHL